MSGLLSPLWSSLLEALVLYPLVYVGRVLDRFKLCSFLRSDGWIPGRGYILRCLLSAVLLVYACECFLSSKMATDWMSGYVYNLTTSHYVYLGDRNRTRGISSDELENVSCAFPVQYFCRSRGEDVAFDCMYNMHQHSTDKNPNLEWYVERNGVDVVVNTSLRYNIEENVNDKLFITQLVILNITEEDYGHYSCILTNSYRIVSYFNLVKASDIFTRVVAPPGSPMTIALRYQSVDTPHYDTPSLHYKINGDVDPAFWDSHGDCSMALHTLGFINYIDQTSLNLFNAMSENTLLAGSIYDEEPGDLDRPLYTELFLRICLSPERFGLYTFYVTRTFYNSSSKTFETVTTEHPWTIVVEPRLPDGINWIIPGYHFIPLNTTEQKNSFKETYETILSDEHMFEKGARIVLVVQRCVFLFLMPGLCLVGLHIYSKYAPHLIMVLWSYVVNILSLILPARTHMPQGNAVACSDPPDYDLWVLSSEDSKYWVNEYIISYAMEWKLLAFWDEIAPPGCYLLSSSLDALSVTKKVIIVASPESHHDRFFWFKFECLLNRLAGGLLSPLDVMLVRWGNVDLDDFRRHNQFEFFDWDNTVFPREVFKSKLSEWLIV